jgi:hypothetical protein
MEKRKQPANPLLRARHGTVDTLVGEQNRSQQAAILTDFTDTLLQVINVIQGHKLVKGSDLYAVLMNLDADIFFHAETIL